LDRELEPGRLTYLKERNFGVNMLTKLDSTNVAKDKDAMTIALEKRAKDPLAQFLQRGVDQSPQGLVSQVRGMRGGANFVGPEVGGALGEKFQRQEAEQSANIEGALDRNAELDFANRMQTYQQLADAKKQSILDQEQLDAQKRAQKKAKRKGFASALGGVAGMAIGGMVGGPAGAYIGSGIGQTAGSAV
jgi:hypothetical protein